MTGMATTPLSVADERTVAMSLFNGTWELIRKEGRAASDDDTMLHMAHASRHHWGNAGTPANRARGEWLCSRVYAVLRRAEPYRYHVQRVLDLCPENAIGDWDVAFGYEALARASALAGDVDQPRAVTGQALAAAEQIADPADRSLLLADLETIPGWSA